MASPRALLVASVRSDWPGAAPLPGAGGAGRRAGALLVAAARGARRGAGALLLGLVLLGTGCAGWRPPSPERVEPILPRLGELLLVGVHGTEPGEPEVEGLLCEARVGGILLLGRNVVGPAQVARFTGWMRRVARACSVRPPLVAVDAEGGRVMRLDPAAGYVPTLSARELGEAGDLALTELEGRRVGRMLREAGIDWDLAPVVDVGINPANPAVVALDRSFGAGARAVTAQARAWIRGLHASGVLAALKHFPGHGSSATDSHHGFVDVTETANPEVEQLPYRRLVAEGLADSIMTAHVVNRRIDRRYPATLSPATITGLLREGLGFQGVVVSDDLRMHAIEDAYGIETAAVQALRAGVDVLLIVDDRLPDGRSATTLALAAIGASIARSGRDLARVESALARIDGFRARAVAVKAAAASR